MAKLAAKKRLGVRKLRWRCPQSIFRAADSSGIEPLDDIIGQERALGAIKLGLEVDSPGYNIYVAGITGTGRKSVIKRILSQLNTTRKVPDDICYVFNFQDPDAPQVLYLPAGQSVELCRDVEQTVKDFLHAIPLVFESDFFRHSIKDTLNKHNENARELITALEKKVQEQSFAIVNVENPAGDHPQLFPVIDEKVLPWEDVFKLVAQGELSQDDLDRLQKIHTDLSDELNIVLAKVRKINNEAERTVQNMRMQAIRPYLALIIKELKQKYKHKKVSQYLDNLQEDLVKNYASLIEQKERESGSNDGGEGGDPFLRYKVNVVVDNSDLKKPPVIIEHFPSFKNLFGTIERSFERNGYWRTDFTRIRAGSLIRANGGYLVLNLTDTLIEPGVWTLLKRALKYQKVDIQGHDPDYIINTSSMKPEPVSLRLKVIIIGDALYYYRLLNLDDDFADIFKVRADFEASMLRSKVAIANYGRFVRRLGDEEGLFPFDKSALAAVVEYGVWLVGDTMRISTRFSEIADLLRESHYWAKTAKQKVVSVSHVERAVTERIYRSNLYEERIKESINRGRVLIQTEGTRVGQINGLTVQRYGDYSFGKPIRITCQVGVGQSGVISIDREADLSGKAHRKGIAIINGYLRGMYAASRSLSMSLSLTFEQMYNSIDGDSASSTEIYAILSTLAKLPLRQDIAVTGSVSQLGEIQPIGGVNEKIEGFFDVCQARGLTGAQGVIIPEKNIDNLMLRQEIVDAARKKQFHIYAISTIDEGLEILTNVPAGRRRDDGSYPPDSVHGRVDARLQELSNGSKAKSTRSDEPDSAAKNGQESDEKSPEAAATSHSDKRQSKI